MKQNKYNYSVFNEILIDKPCKTWYYKGVPKEQNRKTGYSQHKEEFIMIKVTVDIDRWYKYKDYMWGGALTTLDDVVEQGREDEALDIIEEYFSEDTLGYIPSLTELNDFIWFNLPDIMHLYDNEDDNDEDDEEYDEEEE